MNPLTQGVPYMLPLAVPAATIYGTRSSHNWTKSPGHMDTTNLRIVWPRVGQYGIPPLAPTDTKPATLVAFDRRKTCQTAGQRGDAAIHFWRDDYRFETIWKNPDKGLTRVAEVGATLTPDFSLWADMPPAIQIWQTYRSRWCGALWQANNIDVIPTVSWSYPESYDYVFEGLPERSTIAVSATGMRNADIKDLFLTGLKEVLTLLRPARLLVYGKLPAEAHHLDLPDVQEYPTICDEMRTHREPQQSTPTANANPASR
jgi:Domain of unknown function (DUF4417)